MTNTNTHSGERLPSNVIRLTAEVGDVETVETEYETAEPLYLDFTDCPDGPTPKRAYCVLCGSLLPKTVRSNSPRNCKWCYPGGHLLTDDVIERATTEGLSRDAWQGLAGEVIARLAPHTEASPIALLMNLLVYFGNMAGSERGLIRDGSWHCARLNLAIVGPTSKGRKGTSGAVIKRVLKYDGPSYSLSTGEGLIKALMDLEQADKLPSAVVEEQEFARTLRVMKRDGNTLSAIVRQLWDSGMAGVTTRKDPLHVNNAHVSIIGHITQEDLEREFEAVSLANGFANRFLWCYSERWQTLPHGGNPPSDELHELVHEALERAQSLTGDMRFAHSGASEWNLAYRDITNRQRTSPWAEVAGRAEAQMLRLCIVYALMDGTTAINASHVRAALAVWNYSDDVARRLFMSDIGLSRKARKALKYLAEEPDKVGSRTKIRNHIDGSMNARELDAIKDELERAGYIEVVKQRFGNSKKPTEAWGLMGQDE